MHGRTKTGTTPTHLPAPRFGHILAARRNTLIQSSLGIASVALKFVD